MENIFNDSKEEIFYTLVHMNDRGYKLIAESIAEILNKKLQVILIKLYENYRIKCGEINSSASILIDEKKILGVLEERFIREKFTKKFPINALRFVLENTKTELKNCDAIGQGWYPGLNWIKYNPIFSENRDYREKYFYTIPDHLFKLLPRRVQAITQNSLLIP